MKEDKVVEQYFSIPSGVRKKICRDLMTERKTRIVPSFEEIIKIYKGGKND